MLRKSSQEGSVQLKSSALLKAELQKRKGTRETNIYLGTYYMPGVVLDSFISVMLHTQIFL